MQELIFGTLLLMFAAGIAAIYVQKRQLGKLVLFVLEEDDDIKIAPETFSDAKVPDTSETAAIEFLEQKNAGNIEIAAGLGQLLAAYLWSVAQDLIMNTDNRHTAKEIHQKILLYTYVVNCYVADTAPLPVLGETALSTFYAKLEELSDVLYKHASDTAGFSLYILSSRAGTASLEQIGRIYAKLCGAENSTLKIREGKDLFCSFYDECKRIANEHTAYNL